MDRVPFVVKPCLSEIEGEPTTGCAIGQLGITFSIKEKCLRCVSTDTPALERKEDIIAYVNHSSHAVLLSLVEMDLPIPHIEVIEGKTQRFSNPYTGAEAEG